jgi:ribosomal protein S18 acetylase RimI-like enzyme
MIDLASLVFEQATSKDAAALLALESRVASPRIYAPRITIDEAITEISNNTFYFIRYQGVVVGSASVRLQANGAVYFGNIAVDPVYRRQGIARAAMKFLTEEYKSAGRLELVTHPENEAALQLYASLGFKIEAIYPNFFGDGEPRVMLSRTPTSVFA